MQAIGSVEPVVITQVPAAAFVCDRGLKCLKMERGVRGDVLRLVGMAGAYL